MTPCETEAETGEQTSSADKNRLGRYVVLILAATDVFVSLYFILDTRNRLAAQGAAQQASIEQLEQRQGNLEAQIKASNEVWAKRLGITVQQLQTQLQGYDIDRDTPMTLALSPILEPSLGKVTPYDARAGAF